MRSAMVGAFLRQTADNPLNIPRPTNDELQLLVAAFSPVFAIDVTGDFDRIGAPVAAKTGPPGFDFRAPRVYVQPSWAIFDGAPVLQISCLAWFFERFPRGNLDILAGGMDGVFWRVTIVPDGRPLLYDSIHARGCYHLFFPAPPTPPERSSRKRSERGHRGFSQCASPGPGQRMVLHIGSGNTTCAGFRSRTSTP